MSKKEPVPDERFRDFYEAVLAGEYDNSGIVDAERVKREIAEYRSRSGGLCEECGCPDSQHVAVESGGINHIDCTQCSCTIYPRNAFL